MMRHLTSTRYCQFVKGTTLLKKLPASFPSPENIVPVLLDEVDLLEWNPQLPADPGRIFCILIRLADALLVSNVPVTHEQAQYFIACARVRV